MTPTNQPQDCNHVWGKEACTNCGKSRFYQPPAETEPGKSEELEKVIAKCKLKKGQSASIDKWAAFDIDKLMAAIESLIEEARNSGFDDGLRAEQSSMETRGQHFSYDEGNDA